MSTVDLSKLRETARDSAELLRTMNADKVEVTITLEEHERYFIRVERTFKYVGRGERRHRELKNETVTVRDGSSSGTVLYASPLEWLLAEKDPKP